MKLTLLVRLTQYARVLQGVLFPALQEELGPMTAKQQQVVVTGRNSPRRSEQFFSD